MSPSTSAAGEGTPGCQLGTDMALGGCVCEGVQMVRRWRPKEHIARTSSTAPPRAAPAAAREVQMKRKVRQAKTSGADKDAGELSFRRLWTSSAVGVKARGPARQSHMHSCTDVDKLDTPAIMKSCLMQLQKGRASGKVEDQPRNMIKLRCPLPPESPAASQNAAFLSMMPFAIIDETTFDIIEYVEQGFDGSEIQPDRCQFDGDVHVYRPTAEFEKAVDLTRACDESFLRKHSLLCSDHGSEVDTDAGSTIQRTSDESSEHGSSEDVDKPCVVTENLMQRPMARTCTPVIRPPPGLEAFCPPSSQIIAI